MIDVDLLIDARWVLPIRPEHRVLENHSVVVKGSRILDVLPIQSARQKYRAKSEKALMQHVVMPGLINMHGHSAMTLLRGYADDLPLHTWLAEHIWPAEQKYVREDFVEVGTRLAVAEMIRSGTTYVNDMYFFPDIAAQVYSECGFRATIGLVVLSFPTAWAKDTDEYLHKGLQLVDEYKNHAFIKTAFAPHAPYTVDDATFEKVVTYAQELNLPIHIHVHETETEVGDSIAQLGMRPIERLEQLGVLGPTTIAVHLTQINDDDLARLHKHSVHAVHCPESNMKLASGACPVTRLMARNINVCLGTDGAASNNDLDMFGEMRCAALLAKLTAGQPDALPAAQVIEMATINAARALGLDKDLGSLEPGKYADLIAIDMSDISTQPMYNPVSHVVYSMNRQQVTHAWIGGHCVMNERQLTTIDEQHLRHAITQWQKKVGSN